MFIFHPSMVFIIHPPGGRVLVRACQAGCGKYILDPAGLLIIKSLQRACLGVHYDRSERLCPGRAERRRLCWQRRAERTLHEPRLPGCCVSATHVINNQFKVLVNTWSSVFSDRYRKIFTFLPTLSIFCRRSVVLLYVRSMTGPFEADGRPQGSSESE